MMTSNGLNSSDYQRRILRNLVILSEQCKVLAENGVYDGPLLERLGLRILEKIHGWNLDNLNKNQANAPAVDLVKTDKTLAIQITSNLTAEKYKKTISKFKALRAAGVKVNPDADLIIIGLRGTKDRSNPVSWPVYGHVTAVLFHDHLDMLRRSLKELQMIDAEVAGEIGLPTGAATNQKDAIEVLLNLVDRPAIFEDAIYERSWDGCEKAMKALRLLISSGKQLDGDSFRQVGWPMHAFPPRYRTIQRCIMKQTSEVSKIIQTFSSQNRLPSNDEVQQINAHRLVMTSSINQFVRDEGLSIPAFSINVNLSCTNCGNVIHL
jgi:ribosomal protein S17